MTEKEWLEYQDNCESMKLSRHTCTKQCKLREIIEECGFIPFIPQYEVCCEEECPLIDTL